MDVTKPCEFIGFGEIHRPKPYQFIGLRGALISQTPVVPGQVSEAAVPELCRALESLANRSLYVKVARTTSS